MKKSKCKWCNFDKALRKHQRICDECKGNRFFKTNHWRWLEQYARKHGVECWPDDTEGLVKLLELRQTQIKHKGVSRRSGLMWAHYNYELAHRYPASDGGRLLADNLVMMPSIWNKKMGDRHGQGLEGFRVDSVNKLPRNRLKPEFKKRYDLLALEPFTKSTKDNGEDFNNEGVGVIDTLLKECERLGLDVADFNELDKEEQIMETVNKYEELCGSTDLLQMLGNGNDEVSADLSELVEVDRGWWVQTLEPEDIAKLSDEDLQHAVKWKHKLSARSAKGQKVYHAIVMEPRNTSEVAKEWHEDRAVFLAKWVADGNEMPF